MWGRGRGYQVSSCYSRLWSYIEEKAKVVFAWLFPWASRSNTEPELCTHWNKFSAPSSSSKPISLYFQGGVAGKYYSTLAKNDLLEKPFYIKYYWQSVHIVLFYYGNSLKFCNKILACNVPLVLSHGAREKNQAKTTDWPLPRHSLDAPPSPCGPTVRHLAPHHLSGRNWHTARWKFSGDISENIYSSFYLIWYKWEVIANNIPVIVLSVWKIMR